ncbi:thiamine diphosphokinase [Paludifilum halophilum]|uniref:Thiamine diphosphokinase n=1 Tax=Paludifilum halophilum TaxID=1642702 RepID=A0A235B474_9BACL|nr:thiamine diphosphokinase [Paludifilum halophilum]OYD06425.1 thiamine diphosphokinase [Paludifilum halophilum]
MSRRIVIVAGGEVSPEDWNLLVPSDEVIGVDGGLLFLREEGIRPSLAVGDFDTVNPVEIDRLKREEIPVKKLPEAKDMTDTQYAVETALGRFPEEILILGGLGGSRFDHALANLFLLERVEEAGVRCTLRHGRNRVRLCRGGDQMTIRSGEFRYVSLLALTDRVEGLTLRGFLYPLTDAVLTRSRPLGISNELTDDTGRIFLKSGKLVVIESRD